MPALPTLRVFLLLILSSLIATNTLAQRDNDPLSPGSMFEISGQVRSADNRIIENVMVRLETASGALVDQMTTDSMGRFRFARLRSGPYKVSATAAGVVSQPQAVDLSRSSPRVHVLLQLDPESPTFRPHSTTIKVIDVRVPVEAKTALDKGQTALSEKKTDVALSQFKKALEIYPDFYDAHMALGQLYIDTNQWDKAEASFRQALRVDPKSVAGRVSLGEVYRREKKYEDGEKVLGEALKIDNNSWESNFTLGRIHWELKDIVTAGKYVARTLELQPNVAEAHLLAGNIFIRAGLPTNALVEYEEYLRLAPTGEFSAQTQTLVDKLKKSLAPK
ncbi:MAG TPA: tetratricopeptide repeat protein [Pyrinomonadaceae bacterium]|nr:tetratricopeptide repeat protein [Pyrinomonadaceae bacterium]